MSSAAQKINYLLAKRNVVAFKHMLDRNKEGSIAAGLGIGVLVVLLVMAMVFGVWAFLSRQDYKSNSDKKAAAAVTSAEAAQKATLEKEFAEKEKQPFATYSGPSEYGSIKIVYPKTWSLYVDEQNSSASTPINGYGHPNFVPGIQSDTAFALRFQVLPRDLASELKNYESQVKQGSLKVTPFRAEQVPNVLGSRLDGQIDQNTKGSIVIVPLRDKVLKIWTESETYLNDFNTILKNLSFSP